MTRAALYALAESHGFPSVPLRPGERVGAGREDWAKFAALGCERDLTKAWEELERRDGK